MLTWPLYPDPSWLTNTVAASIVACATLQFVLVGLGIVKDPTFVRALGQGPGSERLLLHGPLQYGVVMTGLTACRFRCPTSVVAVAVLSFGDATAALVGKRYGRHSLPWCRRKVRSSVVYYDSTVVLHCTIT
jgi:hypothetical protein